MNDKNQSINESSLLMDKTTIRLYFPHQQGEIGLQQRATLIVNTPVTSIPTAVKVLGLDLHGEVLQLCPKQKKDHDCVTKTLHEELFAGGAKVDVTFYCKGLSSGGCKTKKPARVCIRVTLTFEEMMTSIISLPFTVKGNRRQKVKRVCDNSLRESLSVTTVIENTLMITDVPHNKKPLPVNQSLYPSLGFLLDDTDPSNTPSSATLLSSPPTLKSYDPGLTTVIRTTGNTPMEEFRSYTLRSPISQYLPQIDPLSSLEYISRPLSSPVIPHISPNIDIYPIINSIPLQQNICLSQPQVDNEPHDDFEYELSNNSLDQALSYSWNLKPYEALSREISPPFLEETVNENIGAKRRRF